MKDLTIKSKVWVGYILILLVILVSASITIFSLYKTESTMRKLVEDSQPLVLTLHGFNDYLGDSSTALGLYLFTRNDQQRMDYQNSIYYAGESLTEARNFNLNHFGDDFESRLSSVEDKYNAFISRGNSLFESTTWGQDESQLAVMNNELIPLLKSLQSEVDDLISDQSDIMEDKTSLLVEVASMTIKLQLIMAAVGFLLCIVIAALVTRAVVKPLNQIVDAMQDVAEGDGDLTRTLKVDSGDELGQLASSFNRFSGKVQALVLEVSNCAMQLSASAQRLNEVADSTNSDIQSQDAKIEQVVSSTDILSVKVGEIVNNTTKAAEMAEDTNQRALTGKDVVDRSLSSTSQLSQDVGNAVGVIDLLVVNVESISGVVDVIRGIAEQTNLLALNAAIEAARAGEQGRGFAVVADEVRTLASRTQASTIEIQSMIEKLQGESKQAVSAMNDGMQTAQQCLEQATLAGDSLVHITEMAQGMLEMNRQIASYTEVQGHTADDINQNMSSIEALSSQTAVGAKTITETSQEVNALSVQLQQLLSLFKV